jgi:hypothetical protein
MNSTIKDVYKEMTEEELNEIFTFGYLKDEDGNFVIDDEKEDEISLKITTPYVETKIVESFDDEENIYGDIDNV